MLIFLTHILYAGIHFFQTFRERHFRIDKTLMFFAVICLNLRAKEKYIFRSICAIPNGYFPLIVHFCSFLIIIIYFCISF